MRVHKRAIAGTAAAFFIGMILAYSLDRSIQTYERGSQDIALAKQELLSSAELGPLHHRVYAEVGEAKWEREVKPAFLSSITRATIVETGNVFPDWPLIVEWVRAHPEEARRMLLKAADASTETRLLK